MAAVMRLSEKTQTDVGIGRICSRALTTLFTGIMLAMAEHCHGNINIPTHATAFAAMLTLMFGAMSWREASMLARSQGTAGWDGIVTLHRAGKQRNGATGLLVASETA